ncbi:hypothetical protein LXA43DRAFT_1093885 [Ganoderma leucocontextum]|nr:hypothetical protein LXA43DRAFT_1093885 [Ganoderma leucocontextum]
MLPGGLTRRITRTETLGPGLIPVRVPPPAVPTTVWPPTQRKRALEDDEECTASRKRLRPSADLCESCGQPKPIKRVQNKENCNASGGVSTPLASTSSPSPAPTTESPTVTPPASSPSSPAPEKKKKKKSILDKEPCTPSVQRPQPFRRRPTEVNTVPITMRNNLRHILMYCIPQPARIEYERDAPPRPRLRGTPASNPRRRGELKQSFPKRAFNYRINSRDAARAGLASRPHSSAFLGPVGEREWGRRDLGKSVVSLKGEDVSSYIPPFEIRHRRSGAGVLVYPSVRARREWNVEKRGFLARVRKAYEKFGVDKDRKPAWLGPNGRLKEVPAFPVIPSPLRAEVDFASLVGEGEEDAMEVDTPKADGVDVAED